MEQLLLRAWLLLVNHAASQYVFHKTLTLPLVNLLQIDARQCYRFVPGTVTMEMMGVEAIMEGEYGGDMWLHLSHYSLRTISGDIRLIRME